MSWTVAVKIEDSAVESENIWNWGKSPPSETEESSSGGFFQASVQSEKNEKELYQPMKKKELFNFRF